MKLMTLLACAAVMAATPALAQSTKTPEQVAADRAAAKAEGDALLAKAGAAAFFDNLSDQPDQTGGVALRHKASRLYCIFNPGHPDSEVVLFRPDGTDVGCNSSTFADSRTVYATKSDQTLDQAMSQAVAALKLKHPKAKPYRGATSKLVDMLTASGKVPASRTERFIDGKTYESVSVAIVDGWEIKFRLSGDASNATFLASQGDGMGWIMYLYKATQQGTSPAPPPAAGQPAS